MNLATREASRPRAFLKSFEPYISRNAFTGVEFLDACFQHFLQFFSGVEGDPLKRQFTVLGEVVNLAARFEAMSKTLSTPFVVGSSAYARLPQAVRESLTAFDDQAPKGSARQTVYGCDPRMRESNAEESEEAS